MGRRGGGRGRRTRPAPPDRDGSGHGRPRQTALSRSGGDEAGRGAFVPTPGRSEIGRVGRNRDSADRTRLSRAARRGSGSFEQALTRSREDPGGPPADPYGG